MTSPVISIVIPTISGRADELARTVDAYRRLTPVSHELIVLHDLPTCAHAWNEGARLAQGGYLHMGADDLEPASDAWAAAAITVCEQGGIPIGWVAEPEQVFGRDFARVPFCKTGWWQDVPLVHYYSDNAFTDLMARAGHPTRVVDGYDFLHRRSLVGRDDSPERVARDERDYRGALA